MTRFTDAARVLCVAAAALQAAACATLTRGTTQSFTVQSEPSGAVARTSNGLICDATPCSWTVPRKSDFHVTVAKPGYKTVDTGVEHHLSTGGAAGFAGNVLIGGVIGMGIDYMSGATQSLTPSPMKVTLEVDRERAAFAPSAAIPIYLYDVAAQPQALAALRAAAAASPGVRQVEVENRPSGRQTVMVALNPAAPYGAVSGVEGVIAGFDPAFRRLQ